jgi:hypothetical protein
LALNEIKPEISDKYFSKRKSSHSQSVSVDEAFILWILKMENVYQTINTLTI